MIKASKSLLIFAIAALVATLGPGGAKEASAQTLTEGWGGAPPGTSITPIQFFTSPADACASIQGHFIPYFGYYVNSLISMYASGDYIDANNILHPTYSCVFNATPHPQSTVIIVFDCATNHSISNGLCLPGGYPQDAESLCHGPHGTDGDCPQVNHPISISSGAKAEVVTDYTSGGAYPIEVKRYYRSMQMPTSGEADGLGLAWRGDIVGRRMDVAVSQYNVVIRREDGIRSRFLNPNSTLSTSGPWVEGSVQVFSDPVSGQPVVYREPDAKDKFAQITAGQVYQYTDEDDRVDQFVYNGSTFQLTQSTWPGGYQRTYSYVANGKINSITDSFGRSMTFTWQGNVITNIGLPGGASIQYAYQQQLENGTPIPGTDLLTQVTRYDGSGKVIDTVSYQYDRTTTAVPRLTGIVDASGVLFETTAYDQFNRVTSSQRANGADQVTISYNDVPDSNNFVTRTVTNALGQVEVYHATTDPSQNRNILHVLETDRQQSASVPAASSIRHLDSNGFLGERIDWNGVDYRYTNDAQGRETQRIEDFGGIARTINTTWHPTFRLPTQIQGPGPTINFTYDANGNLTQRQETVSGLGLGGGVTRTWTYTWTSTGLLLTAQGPRTDVNDTTTYTYDALGNLATVKNALNQTTTITAVDARGLPLSVTDPNGVVTNLAYDGVGRVTSITVQGPTPATTSFTYDPNGLLTQAQAPNGVTLTYSYDAAHRLTGIADSLGDKIVFTLDAMGNRTGSQILSGSAQVLKTSSASFDTISRLLTSVGAAGQTTAYQYDGNSNPTRVTDPRSAVTQRAFDNLNRLKQVTGALNGITSLTHDLLDDITAVADPNGNSTTYSYNGFGEVISIASPDSGATSLTRDSAGNVVSKRDARNVVTNYTYDALNRLTSKTFPSSPSENVAYAYDETANGNKGIGHMTSMTDALGSASFTYDSYGNLVSVSRTISGVSYVTSYGYDLAGNVAQIVYPSGRIVNYQRDALGRVATVTTQVNGTASAVTLASSIQYLPFGPATSATLGNGLQVSYAYDQDYRLTRILAGTPSQQDLTLSYDGASNVAGISDAVNSNRSQSFQYDLLGQVTQAIGYYGTDSLGYDAVGNLLSRARTSGGTTSSVTYSYNRGTNQLSSAAQKGSATLGYGYDAAGNLISRAAGKTTQLALSYNADGRPAGAATESYKYDGFGERALINATATSHDIFGRSGELLAENTATGTPLRSYVYLNGLPLALVDSSGNIAYVLADQVGQPQKMVDGSATLVWDRVADIFGATVAQPVGMSASNPLRFPGQQYDAATGLHYNHFRDYDPALGRYVQSDSIGLAGGINTYAYAGGNPIVHTDPDGRFWPLVFGLVAFVAYELHSDPANAPGPNDPVLPPNPLGPLKSAVTAAMTVAAPAAALERMCAAKATGIIANAARGAASEARVLRDLGLTKNTQSLVTAEGRSVPDALTDSLSVEVKDSATVSRTAQVRIQTDAARASGRQSVLVTGEGTQVSEPASRAYDVIIRRPDLGPQ